MPSLKRTIASAAHLGGRLLRRAHMYVRMPLFGSHGRKFWFDPMGFYSYRNIHVGDDVSLGWRPVLLAALSEIRIGSHVMFGPEVVIVGGNHNVTAVGRFMTEVLEKAPNDDLGVTIEDDVWVGARAIILRGVTIGRGAIVGAGALVNKSVPPYAIVVGNPARVVRFRWDVPTIMRHEEALYPQESRFAVDCLEDWQRQGSMLPPLRRKNNGK